MYWCSNEAKANIGVPFYSDSIGTEKKNMKAHLWHTTITNKIDEVSLFWRKKHSVQKYT